AFQKNIGLDAFIIITINFLLMSFFIIVSKFNLVKFKRYFSIFILFFSGFVIGLIIFVAIDILNIAKLNPKILVHLVKPFYKMLNFAYAPEGLDSVMLGDALIGNLTITINKVFLVISKVFSNFYFDNFLFIGLCLIFLISIYKDLKIKNIYSFLFKMIFFLGLVFNTLIFNFRFYTEYLIYIHIFYVILLSACFQNISNKLINSFCTISIICLTFFLPINNFVSQPVSVDSRNAQTTSLKKILLTRPSKLIPLCNNFGSHQPPDNYFIFERYSKQFDADTFSKICNLPKSRFRGDKYVLE
ncbi:hypothetical protein N8Z56_04340, partial [Pelagibacteraceae bacterium]|nr:hypothetical protein [Pelagibacteraceae bacterium]